MLTPANDMFKTKAIVAVVAARPLVALQQHPPEIDLFFARSEELEIDPAIEYVMVEDRTSFYEASRHTLLALQRMASEPFPLVEHLAHVQTQVDAPKDIKNQPKMDLTAVLTNNKHETYGNVNVLHGWPQQLHSVLDASQLAALRRILTKRLAIIQGPPGTGKTYVSVEAIKVILANRKADDPPVIIACQTNHAVDQILRHIAKFEPDFVRLGGRSKDQDVIKKRTLYEVRQQTSEQPPAGCLAGMAKKVMMQMHQQFKDLLQPLSLAKEPLHHRLFEDFNLLSKAQADSLENGAARWVQTSRDNHEGARHPFTVWLGEKLIIVPFKQPAEDFGFEFEEADLAFEQLKELEAENLAKDDEDFESLSGQHIALADNFTCRKVPGTPANTPELLKEQDMWKIPEAQRGAIYRYLQTEAKKHILSAVREKAKAFNEQTFKRRIGFWEQDENVLKRQKVIGMTTTGFSKYRGLISALGPKIVLIEEAAETLEAPVTVTCIPSLQQLILVGDHQQLRPHTQCRAHEDKPFYLNVSLFERMVRNQMEFDTLTKQRRMIPEVRRLLYPIYQNLIKDHPSVTDPEKRPDVPGMGGMNSFFFTHEWPEQRDDQMSCFNPTEAEMIGGFVEYLIYQGMVAADITILTFYNGQQKRILRELRQRDTLLNHRFHVVTVDSYQGEENKVVILSLVRSNDRGDIGFLRNDNRVCVALSRAQCGFYIFGNGALLHKQSKTWKDVIEIIAGKKNKKERPKFEYHRLDDVLPVRCVNHGKKTIIAKPDDWERIVGGCEERCGKRQPCGHACELACHPFSHDVINCNQCLATKKAQVAGPSKSEPPNGSSGSKSPRQQPDMGSELISWNTFAEATARHSAEAKASYSPKKDLTPADTKTGQDHEVDLLGLNLVDEADHNAQQPTLEAATNSTNGTNFSQKPHDGTTVRGKWRDRLMYDGAQGLVKDWSKEDSLLD